MTAKPPALIKAIAQLLSLNSVATMGGVGTETWMSDVHPVPLGSASGNRHGGS